MNRLDIINTLIKKNKAKSYLEIGIDTGFVFDKVNAIHKVGVDPNTESKATVFLTSDEFFELNNETFDIIFIDGLHHADQVEKDINSSLKILNPNGFIVCHDLLPHKEKIQRIPRETAEWTGDCWKAWVKLRGSRSDLSMCVVDTDYGCGIIENGFQDTVFVDSIELTYNNFVANKNEWMNIISIDKFLSLYNDNKILLEIKKGL
jgi:SAM-dependent methyltransferase